MMEGLLLLLLLAAFALSAVSASMLPVMPDNGLHIQERYCALQKSACADHAEHTMCKYEEDKPGVKCNGTLDEKAYLPYSGKVAILRKHNFLRGLLLEKDGVQGQPAAVVMHDLAWDAQLWRIARRWAQQCTATPQTCTILDDGNHFGENIAVNVYPNTRNHFDKQVQKWFNEYRHFPPELVGRYNVTKRPTTGYTQIVWAATRRVGCERVVYQHQPSGGGGDGGVEYTHYLVCLYSPAGNVIGKPVYQAVDPVVVTEPAEGDTTEDSIKYAVPTPPATATLDKTAPLDANTTAEVDPPITPTEAGVVGEEKDVVEEDDVDDARPMLQGVRADVMRSMGDDVWAGAGVFAAEGDVPPPLPVDGGDEGNRTLTEKGRGKGGGRRKGGYRPGWGARGDGYGAGHAIGPRCIVLIAGLILTLPLPYLLRG